MPPLNDEERAARAKHLAEMDEMAQQGPNREKPRSGPPQDVNDPTTRRNEITLEQAAQMSPNKDSAIFSGSTAPQVDGTKGRLEPGSRPVVAAAGMGDEGGKPAGAAAGGDGAQSPATQRGKPWEAPQGATQPAAGGNTTATGDGTPTATEINRMTKAELGQFLGVDPESKSSDELKEMARKSIEAK